MSVLTYQKILKDMKWSLSLQTSPLCLPCLNLRQRFVHRHQYYYWSWEMNHITRLQFVKKIILLKYSFLACHIVCEFLMSMSIIFIGPCIANIFTEYNQQDATFLNLFISLRHSTCLRRFFRPPSGTQNCTYSVRYLSDQYLMLYVQFSAPVDGRKKPS